MKLIDHYTKTEKMYEPLILEEIKALRNHALIIGRNQEVFRVKINGAVKLWKRDPNRFSVPVKYGLYEYARVETLGVFIKEV